MEHKWIMEPVNTGVYKAVIEYFRSSHSPSWNDLFIIFGFSAVSDVAAKKGLELIRSFMATS